MFSPRNVRGLKSSVAIGRYFEAAPDLLGPNMYRWTTEKMSSRARIDHEFVAK